MDLIDSTFRINLVTMAKTMLADRGPIASYADLKEFASCLISCFSTWSKFKMHKLHVVVNAEHMVDIDDPAYEEIREALQGDDSGEDEVGATDVEPLGLVLEAGPEAIKDTYKEYMKGVIDQSPNLSLLIIICIVSY